MFDLLNDVLLWSIDYSPWILFCCKLLADWAVQALALLCKFHQLVSFVEGQMLSACIQVLKHGSCYIISGSWLKCVIVVSAWYENQLISLITLCNAKSIFSMVESCGGSLHTRTIYVIAVNRVQTMPEVLTWPWSGQGAWLLTDGTCGDHCPLMWDGPVNMLTL